MASVRLSHIYKVYPNGLKAVNDFSMDIDDREFIVFVGPSGCGKSTTLRMIAGLEEITAGELRIDGEVVNDVEPKERDIAMVFQNYALYPHMTVYKNMSFGLELRHMPKDEIKRRVNQAARILGITEYLQKKPKEMSGGQRQRVALGRAMVRDPKVFLLDEPLSNLDAKLRTQMRSEILKLHERIKTTFIYVTHDQVEAMTMGTRIVVMKDGFVQQIDTPRNLYSYPCNKFVAGFIGTPQMNFYEGTIKRIKNDVELSIDGTDIVLKAPYELFAKADGAYLDGSKRVIFGIRSEHISIDPKKYPYTAKCKVSYCEDLGVDSQVYANFDLDYSDLDEPIEQPEIKEEEEPKKKRKLFRRKKGDEPVPETDYDGNTSKSKVVIKAPAATSIARDEIIDVSLDLGNMCIFDAETELSIVPRIPQHFVFDGTVKKGELTLLGSKFELPPAIALSDGSYKVELPGEALTLGGKLDAKFLDSEEIGDVMLYRFKADDTIFFVKSEVKTSKPKGVAIDLKQCTFIADGEPVVRAMPMQNALDCRFTKTKEQGTKEVDGVKKSVMVKKYDLLMEVFPPKTDGDVNKKSKPEPISSYSLRLSDANAQRVMIGAGRIVYKDELEVKFSPYAVAIGQAGIDADVVEMLDYGAERFAKCRVGERDVYVAVEGEITGKVKLAPDAEQVSVFDKTIDIRLV